MNPYDKFLYPSYAYPQTHPDNLATLAALFGMEPAQVNHCRVLELGCGSGGNIIPMAFGLPHVEEEFRNTQGASMKTGHPIAKAAIAELADAWPASLDFNELLNRVRTRLQGENDAALEGDETSLSKIILWTYAAGLVELHIDQPVFTLNLSERPVASPLAQLQLQSGNHITNLRHTSVQMEGPLENRLLLLLDGTRDRTDILHELANLVESGAASLRLNDIEVRDRLKAIEILSKGLETSLKQIAHLALLVE